MTVRGTHGAVRQRRMADVTAELGVRFFQGIRCDRCHAGLHDSDGNPRWEIVGRMAFVCLGGCVTGKGSATASGSPVLRTSHRTSHPGGEHRG